MAEVRRAGIDQVWRDADRSLRRLPGAVRLQAAAYVSSMARSSVDGDIYMPNAGIDRPRSGQYNVAP